jgi:EmrB/QacA subfamily drug resistance transporter
VRRREIEARPAARLTPDTCRRLTLAATILGSSMAYVTAVNVAVPAIGEQFDVGLGAQQWIVLSYSLTLASLYLVAGALGDRLGRREMFMTGVVGFALASALAGAAPSPALLMAGRILQGAAGALLTTGSLSLLRTTFGDESGRAIGLWTAGTGAVSLGGAPLGGALVEYASWRWVFYVNLPLAVGAVVLAWLGRGAGVRRQPPVSPLDVVGAGLAAVGLGSLTYALVQGGEEGFGTVVWAFALAAASLAAFLVRERRTRDPVLPLSLFRSRNFTLVQLATLLIYSSLAGSTFFLVLYLQSVIGYTAFEAGLLLIPATVITTVLAPRFGRIADRVGPRALLTAGPMLMALGTLLWLRVDDRSLWDGLIPGLVLYGLGLSMIVAPITNAAMTTAPERYSGVAAGVNATFSRLGGLFAIALLGVVVSVVFAARTDDPDLVPLALGEQGPEFVAGSTDAFRAAMIAAAALAALGGLVSARFRMEPEPAAADVRPIDAAAAHLDRASPDCPVAVAPEHDQAPEIAARAGEVSGGV